MRGLPRRIARFAKVAPAFVALTMVAGCHMVVLDPAGDVARQQSHLLIASTLLMLLIIVPVMALTIFFAWRYRASNAEATYRPDWDHSTQLELVIWAAPLLIIICLGALTWVGTHLLDPYRPLARTAPGKPVSSQVQPLEVQVVALDWKWLFIYPGEGVATVNQLVVPTDRPLRFRISASSVMNSFYIPALAGQIYAMPGMETQLHGVFDRPGTFTGFSANYSGAGFSGMRFAVKSVSAADFATWVSNTRQSNGELDRQTYLQLERPSENVPPQVFAKVETGLFDRIVNLCTEPGKMCMSDMMALDAHGGTGLSGVYNVRELAYDKFGARGSVLPSSGRFVGATCNTNVAAVDRQDRIPADLAPLRGAGLRPGHRASLLPSALARQALAEVH